MNDVAISFDSVSKHYPMYHHITAGLKNFLFRFPRALSELRKSHIVALEDVSFEIERGETFGIVGQNGAGKSTTLGLMAGVLRPSSGTVQVRGRVSPLLELGGGFHQELTGRENIQLNGVLLGLSRREVRKHTDSIIEFSELDDQHIDQPIRTYSSGMLARLGFSILSHLDPEILLIDEVLAVGDVGFKKKCKDTIADFHKQGVTVVLVTHNMEEVEQLCDRALWIDQHATRMIGAASEIVGPYLDTFERES
jgi:lipopolysaccharide transport system ATP-binding protein